MNAKSYRTTGVIASAKVDNILSIKVSEPFLIRRILKRTVWWTGRQPFLTQLIYSYLSQYSAQIIEAEDADIVDEIVRQKVIKNWRNNDAAKHLAVIEQGLLSFENQDTLLILYLQILSRGGLSIHAQPRLQAEQDTLVRSGLVDIKDNQLQVANGIYTEVFGKPWLETQLPGLTRSVTMRPGSVALVSMPRGVRPRATASPKTLSLSVLAKVSANEVSVRTGLSAVACAAFCILFGSALFTYFQAPQNSGAMADTSALSDDRLLFDKGLDHAANARWLPMIQAFCAIPQQSAYFAEAQQQLLHWATLYPKDIRRAHHTLATTQNSTCGMVKPTMQPAISNPSLSFR